jgi:type I restriction enzyme S subunit
MTPLYNDQALDMQGHSDDPPEGWVSAKLPEIAHINMGQSPPGRSYNNRGNGLPFFQGKADFGDRYPTVRVWCSQPKKIAQPGDVLISVRAPVGPTNVADRICAIGRGLAAMTPLGGIPSKFILFRLRLLEPELALTGTGSTFSAISRKDLEEIDIDVPPLAEQKRIVAKVEELLLRVNTTKERLAKVSMILKRFRQAVLAAACSGRLTADWREENPNLESATGLFERIQRNRKKQYIEECERAKVDKKHKPRKPTNLDDKLQTENVEEFQPIPSTWIYVPLARVSVKGTNSIVDGPFGTSVNVKKDYIDNGVPVVRINNIKAFSFLLDDLRFVSETKFQQLKRHDIIPGDVLLTKVGTIGESCVFPPFFEKALLSTTGSCRIRVYRDLADNKFICIYLNSIKNYLNSIVSESVQPFLNMRVVKNLPTALPPIDEQQEIVRRVESIFELTDTIQKRVADASVRAEKLNQAILAKAFRGELVPTEAELARRDGRVYETASELLARIKSQRDAKQVSQKVHSNRN